MTIRKTKLKAEKENPFVSVNHKRIENHKRIMAHLEAIAKKVESPTKEVDGNIPL